MKIELKGIITYEAEITKKQIMQPDFDLEKWAKEEFDRQCEAFLPDEVEYSEYKVLE